MRRTAIILACLTALLLPCLEARGQAAVVIDPSQIAASATNAAEQFDYMVDQLGELADMGEKMNSVKEYVDGIFGEDGIGGKTIQVLQDLGTLDRLTDTYNRSMEQIRRQTDMMKEMEELRFSDINLLLSNLRSAKHTLEMAVVTAKKIISTMGLTKKEKKDEVDALIEEMERNLDTNRRLMEIEYTAAMEAQALDDFIRFTDKAMSISDYVRARRPYGTLDDAGRGSMGLITLLLFILGIVSTTWGALRYIQGGIEGDPVVSNIFGRIYFITFLSLILLSSLSITFGFNI